MASFNQIVLLIGDVEDRQRRAVRDTCRSPFQSHVFDLRKHTDCFAAPLSYQNLQLYLNRPVRLIIMPFYISPTNASHIWSSRCQKKTSITIFLRRVKLTRGSSFAVFRAEQTFWRLLCTLFYTLI